MAGQEAVYGAVGRESASDPGPGASLRSREALTLAALTLLALGTIWEGGTSEMHGFAVFLTNDLPVVLIFGGLVLLVAAVRSEDHRPATPLIWGAAILGCALGSLRYPVLFDTDPWWPIVVLVGALVAVLGRWRPPRYAGTAAVAAGMAGILTTSGFAWGNTSIDVFRSVQQAASELLAGHSPYDFTFQGIRNVHPVVFETRHFLYGPSVALLAIPGRLIGDVRASEIVAFAVLGVVLFVDARRRPDWPSLRGLFIVLMAVFPVTAAMLLGSFVDIYPVVAFSLWLAVGRQRPWLGAFCIAVVFTTKPTVAVALLPFFAWSAAARISIIRGAGLALLLMLPFVISNGPTQLWSDIVGVELQAPSRLDALTLGASFASHGWSGWLTVVSALIAAAVCLALLLRRPRDQADLLLMSAGLLTVSLFLAKWAFLGYYFEPEAILFLALASGTRLPLGTAPQLPRWFRRRAAALTRRRRLSCQEPAPG